MFYLLYLLKIMTEWKCKPATTRALQLTTAMDMLLVGVVCEPECR